MRRSPCNRTTLGGGQARFVQKYESEQCEPGSVQARMEQIRMLRTLADTPELHLCGLYPYQKMSMRHNGDCWIVELETVGSE